MNTLEAVKEFHEAFDCHIATEPRLSPATKPEVLRAVAAKFRMCRSILREYSKDDPAFLRASLEVEEQAEVLEAMADNDLKALLDAYLDKRYIDEGSILTFGLQNVFNEGFHRVHASNMSKLVDGRPIKDEAGKVKKPPTYQPVVLDDLVDGTWLAANPLKLKTRFEQRVEQTGELNVTVMASSKFLPVELDLDDFDQNNNPYVPNNAKEIADSVVQQLGAVDDKVVTWLDEIKSGDPFTNK
jgi:predicted HAD superfamily Cof-like phosphohydrolase